MRRDGYAQRLKEIAGWAEPTLEETPRQQLRYYPGRIPTVAQVQRARTLGSPGVEEKLMEVWTWAKKNWPYITAGGVLYAVLLVATLRRAK